MQDDRGHRPVTTGPYQYVHHPGYTATIFAMLSGGLAFGSWVGMLPIAVVVVLFIRRTTIEDGILQEELNGYADYAAKVRYRLIQWLF